MTSDLMLGQLVDAPPVLGVPDPGGAVVRGGRQLIRADPDHVHDVPSKGTNNITK